MLSIRALPLIIISLIVYNVIAFWGGNGTPEAIKVCGETAPVFCTTLIKVPMLKGGIWTFTLGDLVLLVTLILFFAELVKATYTGSAAITDHALSMLVFIICLIEFLIVPQAATSLFFFITILTLIDVIAGYTIGIRTARRDFNFAGGGG